MPVSNSSAVWKGNLADGSGTMKLGKGGYEGPFTKASRFENGAGTNPEELVAAAHAGCFAMALSAQLENAGMTAERLEVTATVKLEKLDSGFAVTESHLDLTAHIPGADPGKFEAAADNAKKGCPISKLLNARISLNAKLG